MTSGVSNCAKCGGEMVKGFAFDRTMGNNFLAGWIDGEPEQGSFLGIKTGNVKVDHYRSLGIRGYRCGACGYLELYAHKGF